MRSVTEQIKKYISEHLNEPVTLNDIAKAVGYSKFHASRIFKEETGLSLFEYIRRERLTASAFALRCHASNYSSHLRQLYRRLNSASPSYRLSQRAVFFGMFLSALLTIPILSHIVFL